MLYSFIIKTFLIYFFISNNAYAYIDPGMGSLILQAILGSIAAALTSMAIFWGKIKLFFRNLFKKKDINKNDNNLE